MSILEKIVADKKVGVALQKQLFPLSYLEQSPLFERKGQSLSSALRKSTSGIIAEHKRRSPSRHHINSSLSVTQVAMEYENAGACGMSVLTNTRYFGGALEDLNLARSVTQFPLLRKEFIVDEYQIVEAKAHGADAILLIAAILTPKEIKNFSELAARLGLETLLEVHDATELAQSLFPSVHMVGVNNRNLNTFDVSLDVSRELAVKIPDTFVKISESGIHDAAVVKELRTLNYRGFLVGEHFMRLENLEAGVKAFIQGIEN